MVVKVLKNYLTVVLSSCSRMIMCSTRPISSCGSVNTVWRQQASRTPMFLPQWPGCVRRRRPVQRDQRGHCCQQQTDFGPGTCVLEAEKPVSLGHTHRQTCRFTLADHQFLLRSIFYWIYRVKQVKKGSINVRSLSEFLSDFYVKRHCTLMGNLMWNLMVNQKKSFNVWSE